MYTNCCLHYFITNSNKKSFSEMMHKCCMLNWPSYTCFKEFLKILKYIVYSKIV